MMFKSKKLIFQAITCSIIALILNSSNIQARDSGTHGGVGSTEDAATAAARTAPDREQNNMNNPNYPNAIVNPYGDQVVVPETVVTPNTTTTSTTSTTTTTTAPTSPNAPVTTTIPNPNAMPANAPPQQVIQVAPESNQNNGPNQNNGASTFKKVQDR